MAGFHNDIMYAVNADFTGNVVPVGQITANGQLFIGSAVAPFLRAGLLACADGSISYTVGAGTIDIHGTQATTSQKGSVTLATNAETIAGTDTAKVTTPDDIKAKLGVQTLHGLPYGNATTGALQWLAEASNGQIPIGQTGGVPVLGLITSSDGSIVWTFGAGTINAAVSPTGAFPWIDQGSSTTALVDHGYFITAVATMTLPASPSQGNRVKFAVDTSSILTIQANTGQKIRIAGQISSTAGTAVNTLQGDSISLVYRASSATWYAESSPCGMWQTA